MEHVTYFNISPIQFFVNTVYDDIDLIETTHDSQIENIDIVAIAQDYEEEVIDTIETNHDSEDEIIDIIETTQDSQDEIIDTIQSVQDIDNSKINIECFDDRDEDILITPQPSLKVKSKTLDICPNIPEIPTGSTDGVIAKIPVVLAQLVIPINITSFIDLPEEAIKVKDINKRLNLTECVLLQPTNVLFIKGFINKSIEYSTADFLNIKGISGKVCNHTIDIPFECSTAVNFFTQPLDPITNTKEIFQHFESDLSTFNQISEDFFNEIPFCKLLSSKIIEFDELINLKDSKNDFIQIQEKMLVQIRLEILQNQPVVILPAKNEINKT